jgi:beta-galactosidase/beta-glucuronidase
VNLHGNETVSVFLKDPEDKNYEFKFDNLGDICIEIPAARQWSPDHPNIYRCEIRLFNANQEIDKIDTYAIFRKISLEKDKDGITRIFLNNRPLFQYGPLDQGYWPDGLYTPPTDEAMKFDIEVAKDLGFNMIRKHIKVEPARWYYYCDLLGILVWQDMPNGGSQVAGALSQFVFHSKRSLTYGRKNSIVQNQYYKELTELVEHLKFFACIVMWVPFNEGWGQFNTKRAVDLVTKLDSTRLINNASGWVDFKVGHVHDIHVYPGPGMPALENNRAAVNGEFGGLGYIVPDHNWKTKLKWAYRKYKNLQELSDNYEKLMIRLQKLIKEGLSAAVYTQITDVEGEVNGLLTYDREVFKIEPKLLKKWHNLLYS